MKKTPALTARFEALKFEERRALHQSRLTPTPEAYDAAVAANRATCDFLLENPQYQPRPRRVFLGGKRVLSRAEASRRAARNQNY